MADIPWRMDATTHERWRYLLSRLIELDPDDEEAWVLRDEVRSLPGFPHHYDMVADTIVPELVQTSYSGAITPVRGVRL